MDITIGQAIKNLRKLKGVSQESLADAMGVSVQAVSKWETQNSYPDIVLIPQLAKYFGVSIDYLFFECESTSLNFDVSIPDDGVLRIVQFKGKQMLTKDTYDSNLRIKLLIDKDDDKPNTHVEVWGSADIQGCISGGVKAGDGVNCGNVSGGVHAGDGVNCGNVSGGVNAGDGVNCGNVSGGVNVGDGINCGDINGAVQSCSGDIHCQKISGDVTCEGNIIYKQ